MANKDFYSEFVNFETDYLMTLRARGSELCEEAHEAIERIAKERGEELPARQTDFVDVKLDYSKPIQNKTLKKLLNWLGLAVIIIGALIAGQIGREMAKATLSPSQPSQKDIETALIKGLTESVEKTKKMLPMMADEETRVDSISIGPGARVNYHNTLIKVHSKDLNADTLFTELRPTLLKRLCYNETMKKSLRMGGVFVYSYYDKDGIKITEIPISKEECGFGYETTAP